MIVREFPKLCPVCECWVDELFDYYGSKMCDLCLEDHVTADAYSQKQRQELGEENED